MKTIVSIFLLFFSVTLFSQGLTIDTSYSVDEMIMDFFDNDSITISNIQSTGDPIGIGFFDSEVETFDLNAGIVLSSGDVTLLPNSADLFVSGNNMGDEDLDINSINQMSSFNAATIEFDFSVESDLTLDFSYIFGSEEYPEFVGTGFNDAFLFLISGPNYSGPYSNNSENIALVPDTNIVVSINTINDMSFSSYYTDNTDGQEIALDGYTKVLPSTFNAIANEVYRIKIVIADVSDNIYDSAIFLGYNSLGNGNNLVPPAQAEFSVNGNEVELINASKYATSYFWDFGNEQTSIDKNPGKIIYDEIGDYTLSLITTNYCCSDTFTTIIAVNSLEILQANVDIESDVSCFGGNDGVVNLAVSGGEGPYQVTWTPEISDLNAVSAGNYIYSISDNIGNNISGEINITQPPILTSETSFTDATEGQNNGTASVQAEGGVFPYSYLWSNGEIDSEIVDLVQGTYTVEILDDNNCITNDTVTINSIVNTFESLSFDLNISPNPASWLIIIETPPIKTIDFIRFYDIYGKLVFSTTSQKEHYIQVEIDHLPAGLYYISIKTDDENSSVWGKFEKM